MCMADLAKMCVVQRKAIIAASGAGKTARRIEVWRKLCVKVVSIHFHMSDQEHFW